MEVIRWQEVASGRKAAVTLTQKRALSDGELASVCHLAYRRSSSKAKEDKFTDMAIEASLPLSR